jgi:DMSO/TMAO reductase YedYZ molybdopterin-dependent catalytic subunit
MTTRPPILTLGFCLILLSLFAPAAYSQDAPPAKSEARAGAEQSASSGAVLLEVSGEVERPLKLTSADLAKLPRTTLSARAHDEKEHRFDGVMLVEILKLAGVPLGKELRGKNMALYVVVEAADNYRAVFALADIDPDFASQPPLLADASDGKPLAKEDGPLRIVAAGDNKHGRWVRQVVRIVVRRA